MQTETKTRVIDEIKEITATNVAKKQNAAKLNFPNLVVIIKKAAGLGESECIVPESQMNEYDRALLVTEGFRVCLIDRPKSRYEDYRMRGIGQGLGGDKVWQISW